MEEGSLINKTRFAADTPIIAKIQEELQYMVNLVDTRKKHGMKIDIEPSLVMRVPRINETLWMKVGIEKYNNLII